MIPKNVRDESLGESYQPEFQRQLNAKNSRFSYCAPREVYDLIL